MFLCFWTFPWLVWKDILFRRCGDVLGWKYAFWAPFRLQQSKSKSGVKGWRWKGGCKREKKGTQATRAASFAFRPLFQLSQLSLQRPIRIRCTLFCMTDFTWECIAKGRFVAAEHEKLFATECRRRDSHKKPNVNVKKIAVLDFVELTFLQGEDQPHLKIYFRRREELKVRGWI